ncbi:hypothetical protein JCM8208_006467 [Rhodotorula glutinis]
MSNQPTSTSTSSSLPPRASINVLPRELKQYIAQLCADDDDASTSRYWKLQSQLFNCDNHDHSNEVDSDDDSDGDSGGLHSFDRAVVKLQEATKPARSSTMLFQLSKEWADIAAPHRFKTFFAWRTVGSRPTVHVSSRQLDCFRHVDLRAVESAFVGQALSMIRQRVRKISLDSSAITHLDALADQEDVRRALARIEELDLHNPTEFTSALQRVLPRLSTIKLSCHELRLSGPLLQEVLSAPHLRNLTIAAFVEYASRRSPPRTDAPSMAGLSPRLQSLSYRGDDLTRPILDLIGACSSTLETLNLDLREYKRHQALDVDVVFPRLTRLGVSGIIYALEPLYKSLREAAFPELVEVSVGVRRELGTADDEPLETPLPYLNTLLLPFGRPHRTLTTVFLFDPARLFRADELDALEVLIDKRYSAYEWVLAPRRDLPSRALFPDVRAHAQTSTRSAERVRRDLRKTLDHVNALYERASTSASERGGMSGDDARRIARLAEVLSEFEFDRVERGL